MKIDFNYNYQPKDDNHDVAFYEIKLTVKIDYDDGEYEQNYFRFNSDMEEYSKVYCYDTLEEAIEQSNRDINFDNFNIEDNKLKARYRYNGDYLFIYSDIEGHYVFNQYVSDNPIVEATIKYIQKLLKTEESETRFTHFSELTRAIETLQLHWD